MTDTKWKDISTAPKDGTSILAYEDGNMYRAKQMKDGHWYVSCGQPVVYTPEPTHWQPLPSPPAL